MASGIPKFDGRICLNVTICDGDNVIVDCDGLDSEDVMDLCQAIDTDLDARPRTKPPTWSPEEPTQPGPEYSLIFFRYCNLIIPVTRSIGTEALETIRLGLFSTACAKADQEAAERAKGSTIGTKRVRAQVQE